MGMIPVCPDMIGPCLSHCHTHSQPAIPTYGLTRFSNSKRAEKKTFEFVVQVQINHIPTDKAWDLCEIQGTG